MPDMSDEPTKPPSPIKDALSSVLSPLPIGFAGIFVVVGLVVAELIYGLGDHAKFDERIGTDNGFLFLAAIVFARMVLSLNFYPMEHKAKIMKGSSGNLRTNMAIYKQLNKDGGTDDESPAIVMVAEGDVGMYNRANRSLTHVTETVPSLLFMLSLVGKIFPMATFVIVVVYAAGRISHQRGEAQKYGAHGKGFAFSMLAGFVLEGLCWICALKSFKVPIPTFG